VDDCVLLPPSSRLKLRAASAGNDPGLVCCAFGIRYSGVARFSRSVVCGSSEPLLTLVTTSDSGGRRPREGVREERPARVRRASAPRAVVEPRAPAAAAPPAVRCRAAATAPPRLCVLRIPLPTTLVLVIPERATAVHGAAIMCVYVNWCGRCAPAGVGVSLPRGFREPRALP